MEFTYLQYIELLNLLRECGYKAIGYDDNHLHEKVVILRHDIDCDMKKALEMARVENSLGVKSTYYILLCTDFYNIASKENRKISREILELGHEIGLHYDETKLFESEEKWDRADIIKDINEEADILEYIIGNKVKSVSMHIPTKKTLEANLELGERINSYSSEFFNNYKYVSDSFRRWRENVISIIKSNKYTKLHVLTHPLWYNANDISRNDVFKKFIEEGATIRYRLLEENAIPRGIKLCEVLNEEEKF